MTWDQIHGPNLTADGSLTSAPLEATATRRVVLEAIYKPHTTKVNIGLSPAVNQPSPLLLHYTTLSD